MSNSEDPAAKPDRICYLHIGPHKTGTTSIQSALFVNAARLGPLGLAYPTLPADKDPARQRRSHTPLARASNFRSDKLEDAAHWKALSPKIPAQGSVVVSSEHFAEVMREEGHYAKIVDFFHDRGFRIVAIAYVRDQPAWLNSWYTQDQRNFVSRSTFEQFRDHTLERGMVDPSAFLKRFIDDPRIEVRVVSFEQAIRKGLAKSFFEVIGAPADFDVAEPKPSNPNIGIKGMYAAQEIMRRVNGRIRSMPNYSELYESFRAMMQGRGWEETAYVGLTADDVRRVRERYAASNDAFARKWFGTDWATICPAKSLERCVFDAGAASEADRNDVMDVVDRMVALIEASPRSASQFMQAHRARKKPGKKGRNLAAGPGAAKGTRKGAGKKAKGPGKKGVRKGGPKQSAGAPGEG